MKAALARQQTGPVLPADDLLRWYDREKRELPWRKTSDPYRILVSEVMLQQTQVKTVLEYYEPFLERFPSLEALAAADEDEVLAAWKGLGYYRRARNLHACAKAVVSDLEGVLPRRFSELRRLKGIGDYTAAAVASIAFGEAKGVVDGNVLRVMARFLSIAEPIDDAKVKRAIQEAVDHAISPERPGDFNQALMELGATVCTPQRPDCEICPLQAACQAFSKGMASRLPVRKRRGKVHLSHRIVGVVERAGRLLVTKRPAEGLLGGMWEFLNLEADSAGATQDRLLSQVRALTGGDDFVCHRAGQVSHRFSHLEWQIDVYYVRVPADNGDEDGPEHEDVEWVPREKIHELALPRVMQKVWEQAAKYVK